MHIRLLGVLALLCFWGEAEEAPVRPPSAGDAPTSSTNRGGDSLLLLNGSTLDGFQIVRTRAHAYIVEFAEGITVSIPKRQVVSVRFDDIDPSEETTVPEASPPPEPHWIEGQRLPELLTAQLSVPLNASDGPALQYSGQPLHAVIRDVSRRTGIPIECDKEIGQLPPEDCTWRSSVTPGTTLLSLLEHDLRKIAKVDWTYRNDHIVVFLRDGDREAGAPMANEDSASEKSDGLESRGPPPQQDAPKEGRADDPKSGPPRTEPVNAALSGRLRKGKGD